MNIKIKTGLTVYPKDCVFDDLHPKHQIEKIRQLVEMKEDFELSTNSDFIIRELNYLIMKNIILPSNVIALEDGKRLEVNVFGFESKSIDDVIDEQNVRMEELYYKLKYGNDEV